MGANIVNLTNYQAQTIMKNFQAQSCFVQEEDSKVLMPVGHNMAQVSYVTHGPLAQNLCNKNEF